MCRNNSAVKFSATKLQKRFGLEHSDKISEQYDGLVSICVCFQNLSPFQIIVHFSTEGNHMFQNKQGAFLREEYD